MSMRKRLRGSDVDELFAIDSAGADMDRLSNGCRAAPRHLARLNFSRRHCLSWLSASTIRLRENHLSLEAQVDFPSVALDPIVLEKAVFTSREDGSAEHRERLQV